MMLALGVLVLLALVLTLQRRVVLVVYFGTPMHHLRPSGCYGTYRFYEKHLGPVGAMIGWKTREQEQKP